MIERHFNGRRIMFFAREDIPSKLVSAENSPTEAFLVKINLRKKKWLLSCSYNWNRENIENHFETLWRSLGLYYYSYKNLVILGDFNLCTHERILHVRVVWCISSQVSYERRKLLQKIQKTQVALTSF